MWHERANIIHHQPPDAVARHAGEDNSDQAPQRGPDPINLLRSRRIDDRCQVGAVLRKDIVERTHQPATAAAARQIGTHDSAAPTRELFRQEIEIATLPRKTGNAKHRRAIAERPPICACNAMPATDREPEHRHLPVGIARQRWCSIVEMGSGHVRLQIPCVLRFGQLVAHLYV